MEKDESEELAVIVGFFGDLLGEELGRPFCRIRVPEESKVALALGELDETNTGDATVILAVSEWWWDAF